MIFICETEHFGETHLSVNEAFAAQLGAAFPEQKIGLFAETEHLAGLTAQLSDRQFEATGFEAYNSRANFSWRKKIFGGVRTMRQALRKGRASGARNFFWLSLFPVAHLLLNLFRRARNKQEVHFVVLHGELEYLQQGNKTAFEHFLCACLKLAFNVAPKNTHYLVLGASILQEVEQMKCMKNLSVHCLQHPFLFDTSSERKAFAHCLKVCCFGNATLPKGGDKLFALAAMFRKQIESGEIAFSFIGQVEQTLQSRDNGLVQQVGETRFIPRSEMRSRSAEFDVAVFFYDDQSYKLTASGALYETLNSELAVVSFPNAFFTSPEFAAADISFAHSLNEMAEIIEVFLRSRSLLQAKQAAARAFKNEHSFVLQTKNLQILLRAFLISEATSSQ